MTNEANMNLVMVYGAPPLPKGFDREYYAPTPASIPTPTTPALIGSRVLAVMRTGGGWTVRALAREIFGTPTTREYASVSNACIRLKKRGLATQKEKHRPYFAVLRAPETVAASRPSRVNDIATALEAIVVELRRFNDARERVTS